MKIEVGKYYRTRSGKKAYVEAYMRGNPFTDEERDMPYFGYIDEIGSVCWRTDGGYNYPDVTSAYDLVAEWREPVKVSGWVNVFPDWTPGIYSTKEEADACTNPNRIACVYVEGIEVCND